MKYHFARKYLLKSCRMCVWIRGRENKCTRRISRDKKLKLLQNSITNIDFPRQILTWGYQFALKWIYTRTNARTHAGYYTMINVSFVTINNSTDWVTTRKINNQKICNNILDVYFISLQRRTQFCAPNNNTVKLKIIRHVIQ